MAEEERERLRLEELKKADEAKGRKKAEGGWACWGGCRVRQGLGAGAWPGLGLAAASSLVAGGRDKGQQLGNAWLKCRGPPHLACSQGLPAPHPSS